MIALARKVACLGTNHSGMTVRIGMTGTRIAGARGIRVHLPWFLIERDFADKGDDCEAAGGWHRWYNQDDENSGCMHCKVVRPGRLWET
jgi:hypothetical protein